jgi:hypothetical protein
MNGLDVGPLLAAGQPINFMWVRLAIFAAVMLLGSILKKVAENREKAARANISKPNTNTPNASGMPNTPNRTPPATAKKDNPFRNEIEAFLEEVGKRRAAGERPGRPPIERGPRDAGPTRTPPSQRSEPPRKAMVLRPLASGGDREKSEPPKPVVAPSGPSGRPGNDIAGRKAPGTEDLGKQMRTHLAQYLDSSRLATQTQNDLGNSVQRTVRQHLGDSMTAGDATPKAAAQSEGNVIAALLRNPSQVRSAIVVNEILGPPKGLRRRS